MEKLLIEDRETIKTLLITAWTLRQNPTLVRYYKDKLVQLQETTWCSNCESNYTLWDSLGKHLCKTHPSPLMRGVWSCCNTVNDPELTALAGKISGCKRADHVFWNEQAVEHNATFELPLFMWVMMPNALARSARNVTAIMYDPALASVKTAAASSTSDTAIQTLFRTADELLSASSPDGRGGKVPVPPPELTSMTLKHATLDMLHCRVFISRIES